MPTMKVPCSSNEMQMFFKNRCEQAEVALERLPQVCVIGVGGGCGAEGLRVVRPAHREQRVGQRPARLSLAQQRV